MIIGIGSDIVQIPRIEKLLEKFSIHFLQKILTPEEIDQYHNLHPKFHSSFVAKRFAAKEAIAKAFGTGIGISISLQDIIISNNKVGAPIAKVSSKIAKGKNIFLTISDDYPIAVAFAVISD
ncbi:MAG UNVERIFIED_CONTAM: holo-ACP synthase [Rickettsiaceae bacterium]|jgi:holo-[acyl-carrier protein] synthase